MKKLIILLILLIIATGVMGYIYFSKLNNVKTSNDRVLNVAAYNSALVAEFNADENFLELMKDQTLLRALLTDTWSDEILAIKNNLLSNAAANSLLSGNNFFLSLVLEGKDHQFLVATQLQNTEDAKELIKELTASAVLKDQSNHLYSFQNADSLTLFAGIKDDVFIISPSKSLILERLNLVENPDSGFKNYIETRQNTTKTKLIAIYLNFNRVDGYLSQLITGKVDGELAFLNKTDAYAAFSYNFSNDKLQLFGSTQPDQKANYLGLFKDMKPIRFTINNLLPGNVSSYKFYGIDNIKQFQIDLNNYFKSQNVLQNTEQIFKNLTKKYNLDFKKIIEENFNNELITFQLVTGERLGAVAFKNGDKLNQVMMELGQFSEDEVGLFKDEQIMYAAFGDAFKRFNRPYFVIKGNYLVFAPNASTVRDFLKSYDAGMLLTKNTSYTKFRDEFSAEANLIFYFNLQSSRSILRNTFKFKNYQKLIDKNGWGSFSNFAYQMSGDLGKFNTNLVLDKRSIMNEIQVELDLDSLLAEIEL